MPTTSRPVAVIGAGFSGTMAAIHLSRIMPERPARARPRGDRGPDADRPARGCPPSALDARPAPARHPVGVHGRAGHPRPSRGPGADRGGSPESCAGRAELGPSGTAQPAGVRSGEQPKVVSAQQRGGHARDHRQPEDPAGEGTALTNTFHQTSSAKEVLVSSAIDGGESLMRGEGRMTGVITAPDVLNGERERWPRLVTILSRMPTAACPPGRGGSASPRLG